MKNKSSNYSAWNINQKNYPTDGSLKEKLEFIASYGVLAPSTHNTQPWKLSVKAKTIIINPDDSRLLPIGDPEQFGFYISIGACVENIVEAATAFGIKTKVTILNDCVNIIYTGETNLPKDNQTINAITSRTSNKFKYAQAANADNIKNLASTLKKKSTEDILVVADGHTKNLIKDLHISAMKNSIKNKAFIQELTRWLRQNKTRKYDGMPGYVVGNSVAKTLFSKTILKTLKSMPPQVIKHDLELLKSSPAFAIFGCRELSSKSLIEVGMDVERFWVASTANGYVCHPMFAMIMDEKTRINLQQLLAMPATPVFFMRVGKSTVKAKHTPRKLAEWN